VDEHHTLAVYAGCADEGASRRRVTSGAGRIDQVQEEVIILCESVQRGLRSATTTPGKLLMRREQRYGTSSPAPSRAD
jgi:hypothetical protein